MTGSMERGQREARFERDYAVSAIIETLQVSCLR
jgi:hypothetical protein